MKLLVAACLLPILSLCAAESIPALERFSVENMDRSVDPGSDFYRYANGHWLETHPIPEDEVSWSPTNALIQRNTARLHDLLTRASEERPDRSPAERQLGDFYAAALDQNRVNALGFTPIADDFAKISALNSKSSLAALLADFHERGIGACFGISIDPDARQSSLYAVTLGQGGLGLPDRDYYFESRFAKELAAYQDHIRAMLEMAGRSPTEATQDLRAILAIETALAKASQKLEDLSDPVANYHKLSTAKLSALTPSLNWKAYWEAAHAAPFDNLIVEQPSFFIALEKLLRSRSLEDWQAYLRWHLITSAAPYLHEAADQAHFAFYGTLLNGQPAMDPRWKRATRHTDDCLGEVLGKIYVDRFFPPAARQRMREMVDHITSVYHQELGQVPWMSPATRQKAQEKFTRLSAKIGAPESFRDCSAIEVRREDFIGNVERASVFESRREMARIGQPVDRREWGMTTPTVNAYFHPTQNEIVFPAGILQPPFFDLEMDDAVNYGATGATIGHELTHGYDNEGRKYDAEGNLRDWWTRADGKAFDARTAKLVTQFNHYEPLPKLHVNGKLTLAENIADLGGLSIAYKALQRALAADPSKRKLIDGLTPEQRFFLSYAQSWAANERPEYLRRALTTDSHSPDRIRAFAPLLNLQSFYDAFHLDQSAPIFLPETKRAIIW